MDKKKKRRLIAIVWSVSVVIIIVLLGVKTYRLFGKVVKGLDEAAPSTFELPAEDSNLIAPGYRSRLSVNEIYNSKIHGSVSLLYFDKRYNLITYKIPLANSQKIDSLITVEQKSVDKSNDVVYSIVDRNLFFLFQYRTEATIPGRWARLRIFCNPSPPERDWNVASGSKPFLSSRTRTCSWSGYQVNPILTKAASACLRQF